ncbi:DNA polymerase III subunit alpha [Fructilactobacillus vespulae]|uniref:DNA polymerase III subunit alpha n=1 Tax=Fructilactobacillus vespulae TaxID=1249630 RepID=UPI0039B4E3E0
MGYVPLQNISSYSLLQSPNTLPKLIKNAKEKGYDALALTDENVMYGAVAFYKEATKQGIKPIIGLTINVKGFSLIEHDFKLVLLAKAKLGYQNLMKISTKLMTSADRVSISDLAGLFNDIYVLIPEQSEVKTLIEYHELDKAAEVITNLKQYIATDDLKLGVTIFEEHPDQLKEFSQQNNVELIAINSVSYLKATDYFDTKILKAIASGGIFENIDLQKGELGKDWLRLPADIEKEYQKLGLSEALKNNEVLKANCNVSIPKQAPHLPKFITPDGSSSVSYLKKKCMSGLKNRGLDNNERYLKRLNHELEVINRMGFDDYFLIVWDVINFAHNHDIITGPGRGSAAGSLVAYSLAITDVDPIKYDLLFERFLNEERAQMPDIDIDIPDDKRAQILSYVHSKYGDNHVAQIITFGTLGAKQAIRDVGRVFGMKPTEMNAWSKAIPNVLHESLQQSYKDSQNLRNIIEDYPINKTLFKTAVAIEGLPRHFSTHAAGLILSDQPIVEKSPLQNGNEGILMTQYSKYYVEDVGLLKIDFLGLRNLSIMANIVNTIKDNYETDFDITKISLEDPQTIKLFQAGMTNGVFQFESAGIKSVLRRMQPTNFGLIAAVNALYRPGPMENIDSFIKRKDGKEPINFTNSAIKAILGSTFGIIVYQEQVMQLAATMAGFSLGQADVLRKAMSKKHQSEMDEMKGRFIDGAIKNNYSKKIAETTFDYIERFANYGFNKSHAVAYSKMAFELAYLKVHFPGPFFTAILNSVMGNNVKTKIYIKEAKDSGVTVLGPNINQSMSNFVFNNPRICFGLSSIKGLRSDFIRHILETRQAGGPFKDLNDFIERIDPKFRKIDQIKALAYVGCFDDFEYNRRELIEAIPKLVQSAEYGGSLALISGMDVKIEYKKDFADWEKVNFENEYLGTYLSGHPVERYSGLGRVLKSINSTEIIENQQGISIFGIINNIKVIRTKKGEQMAFMTISDQFGNVEVTIFPQLYKQISKWIKVNLVIWINGSVEKRRGIQLIANQIKNAANLLHEYQNRNKKLFIKITPESNSTKNYQKMKQIIINYPGDTKIILVDSSSKRERRLGSQYNIDVNQKSINDLKGIFGSENLFINQK